MKERQGLAAVLHDRVIPVGTILLVIIALWYVFAIILNAPFERDQAARANTTISTGQLVANTMAQERAGFACSASSCR
ncbi:uncharacterized membrane protein YoaK (UPF0700 family) [Phyllobacterium ifriqiyense]|uniref:Uncharacterized membrane protein YoaK (UPF0700 family) n=1 Tax=Phyllobacterium ifriqiyense TaxID=314238 RepID=A0ABU0SA76_9HYPH|nr:uncharacterized membrane protein YoaK (UPF0700 family) [Phyllobacterium ifriqiyense]